MFLQVYEGELRLTVNADRLGFDAPVYVDFLSRFAWSDVTLAGRYRACIIVAEQEFFIEATQSIRTKVTDGMMYFSQSPFTSLKENEAIRLQQLEDVIFGTLREESNVFTRELLQTMACAWQYELWNVFFTTTRPSVLRVKSTGTILCRIFSIWPILIAANIMR